MPFTPFHFGAHAWASLPFHRQLDVFIFVGANVVIDIEPLLVLAFDLDHPVHGYAHTLLAGGLIGALFGTAAYPFRSLIRRLMRALRLPYRPAWGRMALSGALGAWLHVLFDASLYSDIHPFYPLWVNPMYGIVSANLILWGMHSPVCAGRAALRLPGVLLPVRIRYVPRKGRPVTIKDKEITQPMLMYALVLLLLMAIWFAPPLLTKLDVAHPWRRAASVGALLVGFASLALIGWLRFDASRDLLPFMGATALYCGLVLFFTLEFLRHARRAKW